MLDLLRRKAQSPIIQFTVVIIAVVFVFWGVGSSQKNSGDEIARVNDEPISYNEYRRSLDRMTTAYRDQLGESLPQELIDSLGIKEQALEQLIQGALLRQGAREMGLVVSGPEVRKAVEGMEAFRSNGVFDMNLYKTLLAGSRLSPSTYEASLRADLLSAKLIASMSRLAMVTPAEVRDRILYENQEINIEYARFNAGDFTDQLTISEEEIAAYHEEHKNEFMTAAEVNVRYLAYSLDEYLAAVAPDESEYSEFYRQNFDRFTVPETRSARHILLKVDSQAPAEAAENRRKEAEEILLKVREGGDFAELAKRYSEGPSAAQGGDLGFFGRNQMVPEFENAVFSLQQGEISGVVRTSFGFHIIKLEAIKPSRIIPLEEAKKEIELEVKQNQARALAFAAANSAYEKIILAGSLTKYGESGEAEVKTTGFFSKNAPPADKAAQDPAFLEAAFALKKGELSSLVTLSQGYAILFAEDLKEAEAEPLEKIRNQVKAGAIAKQAEAKAEEAAQNLLAAATEKKSEWADLARQAGTTVKETGFFSRQNPEIISTQMLPTAFAENGFSLSEAHPFAGSLAQREKSFYVYRLKEKREPADALTPEQQAAMEARIVEEKKAGLLDSWLRGLKKQAEIEIRTEYL